MGGESSSSSMEGSGELRWGCEMELLKIEEAQLHLVDGEESLLMRAGGFSLKLIKQVNSVLAAVVACVEDIQWPIGKDSPVFKSGSTSYTFALPGLVYELRFLQNTPSDVVQQFVAFMLQYSEVYPISEAVFSNAQDRSHAKHLAASEYWTAVAVNFHNTATKLAGQIRRQSSLSSSNLSVGMSEAGSHDRAVSSILKRASLAKRKMQQAVAAEGEMSHGLKTKFQKAHRLSAVAKLFSKTLLKGAISASGHVASHLGGPDVSTNCNTRTKQLETGMKDVALASVDAFTKVVDAVELAGRKLSVFNAAAGLAGSDDLVQQQQHRYGQQAGHIAQASLDAVGNMANTAWTLNKMGLMLFLRIIAACTVMNIGRGSSVPSSEIGGQACSISTVVSQQSSVAAQVVCASPATSFQPQSSAPCQMVCASPATGFRSSDAAGSVEGAVHMPKALRSTMFSLGLAPPLRIRPNSSRFNPKSGAKKNLSTVD